MALVDLFSGCGSLLSQREGHAHLLLWPGSRVPRLQPGPWAVVRSAAPPTHAEDSVIPGERVRECALGRVRVLVMTTAVKTT